MTYCVSVCLIAIRRVNCLGRGHRADYVKQGDKMLVDLTRFGKFPTGINRSDFLVIVNHKDVNTRNHVAPILHLLVTNTL